MISLIQALQRREVCGRSLSIPDRHRVVEHLTLETYGAAEIAKILGIDDRTVSRDRAAIKVANAMEASPRLGPEMIGHLASHAEASITRLGRIARDSGTPAHVRVDAERAAFEMRLGVIKAAQSVGILPTAATHIVADVSAIPDPKRVLHHLQSECARITHTRLGAPALPASLAQSANTLTQCMDAQAKLIELGHQAPPMEAP